MADDGSGVEWSDAATLLAMQDRGEVSAVEIITDQLKVVERRGSEVNALVHVEPETALAAAAQVDRRRSSGEPLGLLAGVPVSVKDSFAVAGMPVSDGRRESLRTAGADAPVVGRLRSQDAVVFAKSNVATMLADYQTDNPVYGRTDNPWDRSRTPGGSSGGSAAAVSAGLSVADVGSDLSGSIRIPASYTGLFAHVPSAGIVSKRAHLPVPLDSALEPPLSTTGPLARSAADLRLMLLAMSGAAPDQARAWLLSLPTPSPHDLAGTRVGLWFEDDTAPVSDEARAAVERLAEDLAAAGCRVSRFSPPVPAADLVRLFDRLCDAELTRSLSHEQWLAACDAEQDLPDHQRRFTQPLWHAVQDLETQQRASSAWDDCFRDVDVVLAPSVHSSAPTHSEIPVAERTVSHRGRDLPALATVGAWSRLTNVLRGPSTIVPAGLGTSTGLPVGAQLLGPRFGDLGTIAFAEMLQIAGVLRWQRPAV